MRRGDALAAGVVLKRKCTNSRPRPLAWPVVERPLWGLKAPPERTVEAGDKSWLDFKAAVRLHNPESSIGAQPDLPKFTLSHALIYAPTYLTHPAVSPRTSWSAVAAATAFLTFV